jgi:transposase InsO family protein
VLKAAGIAISMDGKGAWRGNVFVERLWRTIKYEEVYLRCLRRRRMRMEVLTGPERRRRWSDEEKLRILIREAIEPGVRYVDVARHHDISPPQLYQWRVALRECRLVDPGADLPGFIGSASG